MKMPISIKKKTISKPDARIALKLIAACGALFLIALLIGFGVTQRLAVLSAKIGAERLKEAVRESLQDQFSGNFHTSLQKSEDIVAGLTATSSVEAQRAITTLANAYFWTGEKEKRIEAVRLTKEQLKNAPGSLRNQAFIINRLIGYMTTAMEREVIAEVFEGEPFQDLYNPESDTDSIFKNLAEESVARYPTFAAYARIGMWHAGKIFKQYDRIEPLSSDELGEHIEGIRGALANMDGVVEKELKANILYKQTQKAQFYYYKGFLYGSLALIEPAYLKDMEEAFAGVHEEYRVQRNAEGKPLSTLETRVIYTNFSLATFLDAVEGEKRSADIETYLQQAIDLMATHPGTHQGGFLAFMHQTLQDGRKGTKGRWYSYDRFLRMAEKYPSFKNFLNANEWAIP